MSIEWMTHVWNNSKQKGAQLLMLLAIADYADEKGEAFPSIETLAQRTRQTQRNAIRIIEKLVAAHELKADPYASRYGTNLYKLLISTKSKDKKPASKRSSDISGQENPESSDIQETQMSSNPSLPTNTKPPLEKKGGRTPDPLLSHPAVMAYREVLHLTPNEIQRKEIAERVGNNGRIESFKTHLKEWSMRGWSPKNVTGILESFETGITSRSKPKGGGLTLLEAIQLDEQERAANGEQD